MVSSEQSNQSPSIQGDLTQDQQVHSSQQKNRTPQAAQQQPASFSTKEGRTILFEEWLSQCLAEGKIDPTKLYTPRERASLLEDWLRTLITQGNLDPRRRLPPYTSLGEPPFNLKDKEVARVINELRREGLLPSRKIRIDKDQPQWTDRDTYCHRWIGHMRALRFDQIQRLLARLSAYETSDPHMLSVSRTSQIIQRWVRAKYAVYRKVYTRQPGWIYLTRKGMFHTGLKYRAEPPKDRLLEHIYYINEVRLTLEEKDPSLHWISERAIQAAQEKRQKGQRLEHVPDGILVIGEKRIDIEVQISRPSQQEVELVMLGDRWNNTNPLRYYISKDARAVVQRVHRQMKWTARSQIEIIDLEEVLKSPTEGESE
jgi:hypothetical protein